MSRTLISLTGMLTALFLVIAAIWTWQHADTITAHWAQPALGARAAMSAAICLAAMAQLIVLVLVIAGIYRRDIITDAMSVAAACTAVAALAASVVMALAAR